MIKHIVMWKFKEGYEEQMHEFLNGLKGLVGQVECLRSLEVGVNCNPNEKYNATLICTFDNMEDLKKYAVDPRHVACQKICHPIALERACVDFEF